MITAFGSLETAIGAIRAGAYDFITKPFEIDALAVALERAVQHRLLREEVKRLRRLVGDDGALRGADRREPGHAARCDGSSSAWSTRTRPCSSPGRAARARSSSPRRSIATAAGSDGPFVAINCAAMPEQLLESELFGHVRGAFTDARAARTGLFVQANGGTLFLDEIGELPLALQPKLLRALQERTVRPIGGNDEVPFDVRVVAATNRDLESAVEEKRFREDLYFRINVIHVEMPPLRARGGDVLLLAQHFLVHYAAKARKAVTGLSSEAAERLLAYAWPGNVRELQNCVERAVALTRYEEITVDDLPEKVRAYRSSHVLIAADDPSELVPLEEVERRYILRVLEAVGGNKTLAARVLGLERKTLYRKLVQWGMASSES